MSKNMTNDLVSVNIATYNRAHLLPRCLDSVLSQTYDNFEVIIVNDSSTDNTIELVNEYKKIYPRIKLITHTQNIGLANARNTAYQNSNGKYIAFMDDDDEWIDEEKLKKQVEVFSKKSGILAIVCSNVRLVDRKNNQQDKIIKKPESLAAHILTRNGIIYSPTVMTKRSILKKLRGFDTDLIRGIDSDFYRRCIVKYGYDVYFMTEITTAIHEYGNDRITTLNQSGEYKKALKNNFYVLNKYKYDLIIYPSALVKRTSKTFKLLLRFIYSHINWRIPLIIRSIKEYLSRYKSFELSEKSMSVIYMTGMPRTGSSLMKNFFGDYPGLKVMPFEPRGFFVNWKKSHKEKEVLIDKSTHYIRSLYNLFATCKENLFLCCIVRDPRDQLCSLFEFDRHPELPRDRRFWEKWYEQYQGLISFAKKHKDAKIFLIRYEDLISNPVEAKRVFLNWAGLNNSKRKVANKYNVVHKDDIQDQKVLKHKKVHAGSFGNWNKVTDAKQEKVLNFYKDSAQVKELMSIFGYYPSFSNSLSPILSENFTLFDTRRLSED